ncbi:MAG: hypothetical protein UV74_C0013G0494 [Candidatus Woesebacteria bacterium GW2011_GWB1_43_14]|uniref:ArnT-like N-terminal domain-containing protein n=1 Tax=Candidatus Woesebacteria bacterium GW2011_GWB1_43_14 TaxID=1618578 RepID=A0A0G1DIF3_9BACT|nr:MAG: hypothetical protein UT21_C0001G0206 [Candidatus Woesebacteria bacterium GW2011_GWA1_39_11b]KKS78048.1 MAG: hypothetical protein UV51_C0003G0083 [Candidatus Woesebacteria bacterium GW2011_GWC1_42_9]KKS97372.1 MAG: hypothetical protein UV74_C0013G0494 [Candidatus Woesebacteria bacterium GW2011_GWB1_43_14]
MDKTQKSLLIIFILALLLRTIKLSSLPAGFHADEVRAGWNAYSILKTGQDDRGNTLAMYYNTFGDFRPTGIIYFTIPSIAILGLNEFAVRLPSALFGALTIFPLFLFTFALTNKKGIALLASLFLAISPWHISVSRATSEVAISMFFVLGGLVFLTKNKFISIISFLIGYLLYHSARLLSPAFALITLLYLWRNSSITSKRHAVSVTIILILLTGLFTFDKEARGRFSQVSIFNDIDTAKELMRMPFEEGENKVFIARFFHNKPLTYSRKFINEYTSYFSANFLIGDEGKPARYRTPAIGVLTYIEVILVLVGLAAISRKNKYFLALLLLLAAPLPAALTTEDAPNLHRSFFMVPFFSIIEAIGFSFLTSFKPYSKLITVGLSFAILANFIFFWHMYSTHAVYKISGSRSYGSKELALQLNEVENKYDQIFLTNIPDDPYPWIAFFNKLNPDEFNKSAIKREHGVWTYRNYIFTTQRCPSQDAFDNQKPDNILAVDAEGCSEGSDLHNRGDVQILSEVKRPNEAETVIYTLWSKTSNQ